MKKTIKYLCTLSMILSLSFVLVGCRNETPDESTNTNTNDTTTTTSDLDDVDSQIKSKFNNDYTVSRDDVSEAVEYINDHYDKIDDREVAKKIYEKGSYLEAAAKQGNVGDDDAISTLGSKAKAYARDVYSASNDKVKGVVRDGAADIKTAAGKIGDGVDGAVDKFMNFFTKKQD